MARHSLRGKLKANEKRRLILDDGRFTHGDVVESFQVWNAAVSTGNDVEAVLALSEDSLVGANAAEDNGQIAWSFQFIGTNGGLGGSIIDPDHLVVRDLWIENISGAPCNYLVVLRPTTISEDQAVLALIKELSQDV